MACLPQRRYIFIYYSVFFVRVHHLDHLVCWLVDQLIGWLAGRMDGWWMRTRMQMYSVGQLVGWLVLVGFFGDCFYCCCCFCCWFWCCCCCSIFSGCGGVSNSVTSSDSSSGGGGGLLVAGLLVSFLQLCRRSGRLFVCPLVCAPGCGLHYYYYFGGGGGGGSYCGGAGWTG